MVGNDQNLIIRCSLDGSDNQSGLVGNLMGDNAHTAAVGAERIAFNRSPLAKSGLSDVKNRIGASGNYQGNKLVVVSGELHSAYAP